MSWRLSTERLARTSARRPWVVILAWLVGVVAAGLAVAALLGGALTSLRIVALAVPFPGAGLVAPIVYLTAVGRKVTAEVGGLCLARNGGVLTLVLGQ